MNINRIKKGLECCSNTTLNCCKDCPYYIEGKFNCFENKMLKDALNLINKLENENKELRVVTDIANERTYRKKFTDEWRKEYQKELDKGHIAGYPDFDLVYKLYFEQKDRIAELEKEIKENAFYSKGYAQGIKNTYEVVVPDKLKQFATLLKAKTVLTPSGWCVNIEDIDETLKEYEK